MDLRPAQRQAVEHDVGNLLVVASAGTGKTTVLTRRCVRLLADLQPPCGVDELLVVTFTRAAAAELRSRLAEALRQRVHETRDRTLAAHLRQQQALLDAADIGTIDSWAGRLVRQYFDRLGIDPGFTMLSEQDAGLLAEEVLDAVLDELAQDGGALGATIGEWLLGERRSSDRALRRCVLRLHRFRDNLLDPDEWLARQRDFWSQPPGRLREQLCEQFAKAIRRECTMQIEQLAGMIRDAADPAVAELLRTYRQRLQAIVETLKDPGCVASLEFNGLFPTIRKKDIGEENAHDLRDLKKRWFEQRLKEPWGTAADLLDAAAPIGRRLVALIDLEQRFHEMLWQEKSRRAAFEFGDVLRLALRLLGRRRADGTFEPTDVAQRLRDRYRFVLVDEYQDTSPVQVELLRLVARDEGNRFLVGDVKQSIYGFRQAEPQLFVELIEQVRGGALPGRVQPLGENFRSHPGVLEPLNAIFERLFERDFGGSDYDPDERLVPCRDEPPNATLPDRPRIELALFDDPSEALEDNGNASGDSPDSPARDHEDDALELERIEREATWAARRIRLLLETGTQVLDRGDDGAPVLRPLEAGDIVVLLRSARGNAPRAAARLRELGVPAVVLGRESLLECLDVQDVLNILRLIANRRQDIPLAAYLRSPVVGLTDDELLAIRNVRSGPFWQAVLAYARQDASSPATANLGVRRAPDESQPPPAGDAKDGGQPPPAGNVNLRQRLRDALDRIDHWRQRSRHLELPALLREILRDTALPLVAAARPPAEYRVAMLRALQTLAAQFAASGHAGVREFVDWIEQIEEQELAPVVSASLRSDVVRIMTIHASKGLEFPVVFLLNTGAEFSRRGNRDPLLTDADEGLSLDSRDVSAAAAWTGPCKPLISQARRLRDRSEELRLLYVAGTRARELLLIAGHLPRQRRERIRGRFRGHTGKLSLFDRLSAASVADWLLMSITAAALDASADDAPPVRVIDDPLECDARALAETPDVPSRDRAWADLSADDEAWIDEALRHLASPPDLSLATVPAVVSVSELKHRAAVLCEPDLIDGGLEDVGPGDFDARLDAPAFARTGSGPGGAEIGTAYHRLLQFIDLDELSTREAVERQIQRLRLHELLTDQQAATIDPEDLVWFGRSELGRRVAANACRVVREQPFVCGRPLEGMSEWQLLRGIVDLMWADDAGWSIVDFKTDLPRRREDHERRLRMYRAQLRAYGEAISQITGRPLAAGWLVFLRRRELVRL